MARVLIKNFTHRFKDVVAVKNINIEVQEGAFAVLVGPSGCGKTTILRAIAGLLEVCEGEIYIGDRLVNDLPPKDRDIAMVFQDYALYPHMTVFDNIAFNLKLKKVPKKEIKERVKWAASVLGIEPYLDRKPRQLSGGQRQRVAVGRAIVRRPKVFLFDEPLSNLDAKLRVEMRAELKSLHKQFGITTIYVTHDQIEAMSMASQMFVIKDGVLQQSGHPLEIYRNPTNVFVAGFIGTPQMNFINAVIKFESGNCFAMTRNFRIPLSYSQSWRKRLSEMDGRDVVLGIRPENLFVDENYINGGLSLVVEPDLVEPLGDECYIHFYIDDVHFIAKTRKDPSYFANNSIKIDIKEEYIHIFDKNTGYRV
jgi:multiple sugar transport system ATP-binding protein